jgi:hypothetical protein
LDSKSPKGIAVHTIGNLYGQPVNKLIMCHLSILSKIAKTQSNNNPASPTVQ